MAGATSLVQLILKKWGDDAAKVAAPAAGVAAAGQSEDADAGFVTKGGKTLLEAWHGSPHKFDEFSMDQIGTGEGAQAYGHGLYFADSEDVARGYRERLTKDGKDIVDIRLKKAGGDIDKAIADTEAMAEKYRQGGALSYAESNEEDLRFLRQFKETGQVDDGALYRTEIDVTPESLLDLDKPLNNQSDYVQERLQGIMGEAWNKKKESWTGRDYQRHWSGDYGDSLTTDQLLENGILGSRYLDGDHRGKFTGRTMRDGQPYSDDVTFPDERSRLQWKAEKEAEGFDVELDEGSSNYVIFDDSLINIAERGNADPRLLAGTAAGTAGLLGLAGSEDADAAVPLRLLKEAPEAYNSLRKQIARGRQKGLSPQRVAEKFIHDQSITNYDKGFNSYARKVDGMESGDYWKQGVQSLYDEIMGAVDEPDPMVAEAMGGWLDSHLGREAGVSMAENRARALKKRKAAAAAGGGVAGGAAGGASADEGLPVPTWGDVGESLFTVLDMPMTGLQGMARGIGGLLSGEDLVTAAAEANHMMGGGSEEGWRRVGEGLESLMAPIDRRFPYLRAGKAAGDTASLGLGLLSPF